MEITAALERADKLIFQARRELEAIKVADTVAGGPMLELDIGRILTVLNDPKLETAIRLARRHARDVEAVL